MKTAALLEKRGVKYFKLGLSGPHSILKRKLRIIRGFRKIAFDYYYLPYTEDVVDFLIDNRFEFNGAFQQIQEKEYEKANPIKSIPKYDRLGYKLYKYQIEGVNYIEHHDGRCLIADEMGLGKTIQALAWLQIRKDLNKILIVCPSSLKINWEEETEKWITRKLRVQILDGTTPYPITGDVVIINYDILHAWIIDLKLTDFKVCIADELHYCKNSKAARTKAFIEITKGIPNLVGLTGTPIENDPVEIFYIVNLINRNIFPNYVKFIERYCGATKVDQIVKGGQFKEVEGKTVWVQNTRSVWKKSKYTNQAELHRILKKYVMIRRTKNDVDLQLPPKVYATIDLKLDNIREYREAEDDFIQYIKNEFDKKAQQQLEAYLTDFTDEEELYEKVTVNEKIDAISRAPALAKIQALKLIAAKGKMSQVIDWIHDFLDTDEKLIIFAINKVIVKTLMDAFPFAVKIDGSVSKAKRNKVVKSFQNDPKCRLFVGNMKAAGIGLTLTAASKVTILQFPWNPGELVQAEDRAHRITQKKKVTIYKFVAKGTIEERIVKLLRNKQIEIDKIIDGKNMKAKTDMVKLLIDSYK